jgi:hypothetical protein
MVSKIYKINLIFLFHCTIKNDMLFGIVTKEELYFGGYII